MRPQSVRRQAVTVGVAARRALRTNTAVSAFSAWALDLGRGRRGEGGAGATDGEPGGAGGGRSADMVHKPPHAVPHRTLDVSGSKHVHGGVRPKLARALMDALGRGGRHDGSLPLRHLDYLRAISRSCQTFLEEGRFVTRPPHALARNFHDHHELPTMLRAARSASDERTGKFDMTIGSSR